MTRNVTRIVLPLTLLTATLALALPAQAALTRTFVSAAGSDANPCTITAPCASFAHAYSLTAANGIVAALDPGKYGPLTITGPITINGNGWAAITAPAGGDAIDINAGASDNVALLGLEIDGAGAGYNGIVLNAAGSLTVTNCTLQNFASDGIHSSSGIVMQPTAGIFVGFGPATIKVSFDNVTVSGNTDAGIRAQTPADVLLSRSVITGNTTGVENDTSPNTFYSYQDNRINLNGTDIAGLTPSLNTTFATQ